MQQVVNNQSIAYTVRAIIFKNNWLIKLKTKKNTVKFKDDFTKKKSK